MKQYIVPIILCSLVQLCGMDKQEQKFNAFDEIKKSAKKEAEIDRYGISDMYSYLIKLCNLISLETIGAERSNSNITIFSSEYYNQVLEKIGTLPSMMKIWDSKASYAHADSTQNNNDFIKISRENVLKSLWVDFLNIIKDKKQWQASVQNNLNIKRKNAVLSFDSLIAFRLNCMVKLKLFSWEDRKITNKLFKSPLEMTEKFNLLAVSRFDPFYWGNWYDRLHRSIHQLPSFPWQEKKQDDKYRSPAEIHCEHIVSYIDDKTNGLGSDNEDEVTYQKCILMFYLLAMREMRIIIADFYEESRMVTWGLRGAGLLVGGLGITSLYRYLTHGTMKQKKENSDKKE